MRIRTTADNPDSQFAAMPHSITPVGMELNPTTEPITEPLETLDANLDINSNTSKN